MILRMSLCLFKCYSPVCIPHLVAIHLVAMFEGKCSAERNVDGIAHNGHGKSVAYHLREQRGIWSTRGLEPGTGRKDECFRFLSLLDSTRCPDIQVCLQTPQGIIGQLTFSYRALETFDFKRNVTNIFLA